VSLLEGQIHEAASAANAGRAQVTSLEEALAGRLPTVETERTSGKTNWAADDYKSRLTDLRLQEADLAARYAEDHRPLVELRDRINHLETMLATEEETHTEVTTGLDANYRGLDLSLATERAVLEANQARHKTLVDELAEEKAKLAALTGLKVELDRLEREVDVAEQEYRKFRDQWQQAKISAALDRDKVSNVSIVQQASLPLRPIRPLKLRNIGLGLLIGLLGGIGLAFFRDYFDDSLKKDSDVERRLGLPVLASVSESEFRSCT
jgi:uncharacterized protein involved in exopolysaccharide biosynthesis